MGLQSSLPRAECVVAQVAAGMAIAVGGTVVLGWHLDSATLVRLYPPFAAMPHNVGLALIATGVALLLLARRHAWGLRVAPVVVCVPIVYAVLTVVQAMVDGNFGIDELFYRYPTGGRYAGRMSAVTALCFIALGLSLLCLRREKLGSAAGLVVALASCAIVALSLAVIVTGLLAFGLPRRLFFAMAPPTALGLAALGSGVLALTARATGPLAAPSRLPALVLVSLAAVVLVAWQALDVWHKGWLDRGTDAAALAMERQVQHALQVRLELMTRTAQRWQRQGVPPVTQNVQGGRVVSEPALGCVAIEWFDANLERRWIVARDRDPITPDETFAQHRRCLLAAVRQQGGPRMVSLRFADGAAALVMADVAETESSACLAVTWNAAEALAPILNERIAPDYGAELRDELSELYRRPGADSDADTTRLRTSRFEVFGSTFELRVWPTSELLHRQRSYVPELILVGGLLLVALVAGLIRFVQVGRLQARELASANDELRNEIAERRRAEEAWKQAKEGLREALQRFRQLADHIDQVFWLADPTKQELIYLSPAYERIWGQPLQQGSAALLEGIHVDDRARVYEAMRQQIRGETTELTYRVVRPDGSVRWVLERGFPIQDSSGLIYRVSGIVDDITERKQLQEQMQHAQKMQAVGQLAGGIAHEFNNLLTAILGHCAILRSSQARDAALDSIGQIERAGNRAADLTAQLLAFGRKQVSLAKLIDVNDVIRDFQTRLGGLLGKDVQIVPLLRPGLGRVFIDPSQLSQVILHLALNARDAMPAGGTLTIETALVERDPPRAPVADAAPLVLIRVKDTGRGMDAATLSHVFEPFFTTKETGRGTGLGLAVVHGIIEQAGGRVEVESQPGRGSIFSIYLPLADQSTAAAPPGPVAPAAHGREAVLLVEDDAQVCDVIRQLLGENGYAVLATRDPEEALAICNRYQGPIDLLVTNVVMPDMGGRALAEWVSVLRPRMRVLFLSGHSDAPSAGADGVFVLTKPFTSAALLAKVREVLECGSPCGLSAVAVGDEDIGAREVLEH